MAQVKIPNPWAEIAVLEEENAMLQLEKIELEHFIDDMTEYMLGVEPWEEEETLNLVRKMTDWRSKRDIST